jgi:hypothetical protein
MPASSPRTAQEQKLQQRQLDEIAASEDLEPFFWLATDMFLSALKRFARSAPGTAIHEEERLFLSSQTIWHTLLGLEAENLRLDLLERLEKRR